MKILGGLLLAIGILIAGASGLCSIAVLWGVLTGSGDARETVNFLPFVAVIGGVPFAAGVGLVVLGVVLLRRDD